MQAASRDSMVSDLMYPQNVPVVPPMSLGRHYEGFCANFMPFNGMGVAPDASITLEQNVRGYPAAPDMNSCSSHFHEAEHPQPD